MRLHGQYFCKIFSGTSAFSSGINELKEICQPVRDLIKSATDKTVNLGLVHDFAKETWPNTGTQDKVLACLLTMQALLSPANMPNIFCQANPLGLAYRTNSGLVFGWRRYKDTNYLLVVKPVGESNPNIESVKQSLLENGWKPTNARKGRIPCYIGQLAQQAISLSPSLEKKFGVQKKSEPVVDNEVTQPPPGDYKG